MTSLAPPCPRLNYPHRAKRRADHFPNEASAIRLVGAIVADLGDEWQAIGRRYVSEDFLGRL